MHVPDLPAEPEYSTIDNDYVEPCADHHYQGLQRAKGRHNTRTVLPLNIEASVQKRKRKCKKPPCWGWALIIIGIGVILALGQLLLSC